MDVNLSISTPGITLSPEASKFVSAHNAEHREWQRLKAVNDATEAAIVAGMSSFTYQENQAKYSQLRIDRVPELEWQVALLDRLVGNEWQQMLRGEKNRYVRELEAKLSKLGTDLAGKLAKLGFDAPPDSAVVAAHPQMQKLLQERRHLAECEMYPSDFWNLKNAAAGAKAELARCRVRAA